MTKLIPEFFSSTLNRVHGITRPVNPRERRNLLKGAGMLALGGVAIAVLEACNIDPASIEPEDQVGKVEAALISMVGASLDKIVQPGTIVEGQTVIPIITIELPSEINDRTNTVLSLKKDIEGGEQTIYVIPDLGSSSIDSDGQLLVIRLKAHMWLAHGGNLTVIENEELKSEIMAGDGVTSITRLSPKEVWDNNLPHDLEGKVLHPGTMRFHKYNLQPNSQWQFNPDRNEWTRAVEADPGTNLS
ncbi:hypothetical protein KBC89_04060 [Candidatus Woesebacteria bacterium]|nr:hypothetical protein [Candidatus Woesebacteria bacterium]